MRAHRSPQPRDEDGFSLVELLVVGLPAAIALPLFLRRRGTGDDAASRAGARYVVGQVEACPTSVHVASRRPIHGLQGRAVSSGWPRANRA